MRAREILSQELERFSFTLSEELRSDIQSVDRIMKYLSNIKGKQLRPVFLLLCARLGGPANDSSYRAAALIEILHVASLVHDDIVDHSMKRRNAFSVNALWKSRSAVFAGDILFTKGVLLSLDHKDFDIIKIFSKAIEETIEGELVQISKTQKLNLKEEVYYTIIRQKTATLLRAACEAGASTTFKDAEMVSKIGEFGEMVGMAFQIKDDLLDYGTANIGKPVGNDIRERKMTLPLIYTLNNCEPAIKQRLLVIINKQHSNEEKLQYLREQVRATGGFKYAEDKMLWYRNQALNKLYELPESEVRKALEELVFYITERNY